MIPTQMSLNSLELRLTLTSTSTDITRSLVEKQSLKLGRQVKSDPEKDKAKDLFNAAVTQELAAGDTLTLTGKEAKALLETKEDNSAVWFKSKVVSRIHAEIWLREGQVFILYIRY
jgi:hypothetical protein